MMAMVQYSIDDNPCTPISQSRIINIEYLSTVVGLITIHAQTSLMDVERLDQPGKQKRGHTCDNSTCWVHFSSPQYQSSKHISALRLPYYAGILEGPATFD